MCSMTGSSRGMGMNFMASSRVVAPSTRNSVGSGMVVCRKGSLQTMLGKPPPLGVVVIIVTVDVDRSLSSWQLRTSQMSPYLVPLPEKTKGMLTRSFSWHSKTFSWPFTIKNPPVSTRHSLSRLDGSLR